MDVQEVIALSIVGLVAFLVFWRTFRGLFLPLVVRILLRGGRVKLAMRLRALQ